MPDTPEELREMEDLLPFYVNGTLQADERTRVEAALSEDDGLRTELQFLQSLRSSVKHNAEAQARSSGELGETRRTNAWSKGPGWCSIWT